MPKQSNYFEFKGSRFGVETPLGCLALGLVLLTIALPRFQGRLIALWTFVFFGIVAVVAYLTMRHAAALLGRPPDTLAKPDTPAKSGSGRQTPNRPRSPRRGRSSRSP